MLLARLYDGEARRAPAFSVGATILEYEIRHPDSAEDFHAAILAAEIVEVSMTDNPACPGALVRSRFPTSAMVEQHDLVIALIKTAAKIIELARSSGAVIHV